MKPTSWIGVVVWVLWACGGPTEVPPGASAETEGAELAEMSEPETAAESGESDYEASELTDQAISAPAGGPSSIRVDAFVNHQPVAAEVRILDGQTTIASGEAGQLLTAQAGEYEMEIAVKDGLVDRPVQHRTLTLLPGGDISEKAEFPWAKIQLMVRINGALSRDATVDIIRDGETVATLKSNAPHVLISPGRYRAVVKARGAKIEVSELMFPAEATQTVPVNVQM